jgi:hypothetical protein
MPSQHRTPRQRTRAPRRRFLAGVSLVALALVGAGVAAGLRGRSSVPADVEALPTASLEAPAAARDGGVPAPAARPVFPYSVVPGGVDSVEELKKAIAADPVVAEHYKNFDLSKARVERLDGPRVAHVSYRIGEHVYWTRKTMVIPAGERVISDGTSLARTRCGNQIADEPGTTSAAEPPETVLNTPASLRPLSSTPIAALPATHPVTGTSPISTGSLQSGGAGGSTSGTLPSSAPGGYMGGGVSSGVAGPAPVAAPAALCTGPCAAEAPPGSEPGQSVTPLDGVPPRSNGTSTPFRPSPPSQGPEPGGSITPLDGVPPPPNGGSIPPFVSSPPFDAQPGGPVDTPFRPALPGLPPDLAPGPPPDTLLPPGAPDWMPPQSEPGPLVPGVDAPPGLDHDPNPAQPEVPVPVPEPGSIVLMLTGGAGLLARLNARRRG